jgi:hypothetical protein
MTVSEAINEINTLKPNSYGDEEKTRWLERLDGQIRREILDTHFPNDGESIPAEGDYDGDTELLALAPYDELYVHYLAAQIDYYNREYEAFNATNAMFDACYASFRNKVNATHRPRSASMVYY